MNHQFHNGNEVQLLRFHLSQPESWGDEHLPLLPPLRGARPAAERPVTEFHLTAHLLDHDEARPEEWLDWAATVG